MRHISFGLLEDNACLVITVARIVKGNEFKSDNDTETIAFYIQVLPKVCHPSLSSYELSMYKVKATFKLTLLDGVGIRFVARIRFKCLSKTY